MALTYAEGTALMSRCRDLARGKPIAPHTRLRWTSPGSSEAPTLVITLWSREVIWIYPDDTYRLSSGYWKSPLTKQRLNTFSPAHVASAKLRGDLHYEWYVWHESDLITDPKIRPCRHCEGTGRSEGWTDWHCEATGRSEGWTDYPCGWCEATGRSEGWTDYPCGWCEGTGACDYGSRQVPHAFHEGILVDETGAVIDPDGRDYLTRFALMSNPGKRLPRQVGPGRE